MRGPQHVNVDADKVAFARRIVEARLGRSPQDMLEAAVVLEAWGGLPAEEALAAGDALVAESRWLGAARGGAPPKFDHDERVFFESAAFVIAVLAIACWSAPLAVRGSAHELQRALTVALPVTLMLQWWLRSRYLGRKRGLALLGRRAWAVPTVALALVALPGLVLGSAGLVAGLLTVVWSGGTILVGRHWWGGYVVVILLATVAMAADVDPLAVLATAAAMTGVAVVAAVRPPRIAIAPVSPGRSSRALVAATIGGAIGVLLVADGTAGWGEGVVPALALVPSAVASVWAGYRLWGYQDAIAAALHGAAVDRPDPGGVGPGVRVLLAAVARLVSLTAVLSMLLLLVASLVGTAVGAPGLLVGFGLVALTTMLVSLLEAIARPGPALLALGCAIPVEVVVQWQDLVGFAGGGLVVGASLAVALTAPMAIAAMQRSATTLATSLWIP